METKRIEGDRLARYFEDFTKRYLADDSPEEADIEVLGPEWGEQPLAHGVRLLGITFDRHTKALEFELEAGDHRAYEPREVWVREDPDGFPNAVEVVRPDGAREVVNLRRVRPEA